MRKTLRVKEWFVDKQQEAARRYNMYIDVTDECRGELGQIEADANGMIEIVAEILKESEKAIQAKLETGSTVGSNKGWTCWIPKSLIA